MQEAYYGLPAIFRRVFINLVRMDKNLLHIEVGSNRRLLEDLCYNVRVSDVR